MRRKIIFIILGALAVLLLLFLLWFWFLGREETQTVREFGTGGEQTGAGEIPFGEGGNQQTPFGSDGTVGFEDEVDENLETPIPTYSDSALPSFPTYDDVLLPPIATIDDIDLPDYEVPGVTWVDGGALANFSPTPINRINSVSLSGTPYILNPTGSSGGGDDDGGLGLGGSLIGAGLAGAVSCSGFLTGSGIGAFSLTSFQAVQTNNAPKNTEDFMDCLTRTIARIAIAEITASTVDWINSGFDGKPAFIENYEQFFTSVADQAAGEFIQGSALSFLCSPFQLQVKVAIAQSYAKRRSGESNQCSLSSVVGNVEGFLAGDFAEGGWPGLISLTTVPTNNPFGAYMYAQAGLESAQVRATTEANRRITPGGFLAQQDCGAGVEGTSVNVGCKIILPGAAIEDSLENALGTSLDSLQLADHFDEIIAALINQLMTKVLYEGLSNVSGPNGYQDTFINPINTQATEAAKTLLREMQQSVSIAQQYGGVEQGSIGDIQNVQQSLTELQNCWVLQGADAQASEAEARRTALEPRIAIYNSNITRASSAISKVEQLHTSLLSAKSLSDVQAVRSQFGTAQSSGQLVSQTEITSAQQDRTTLQVEMGTIAGQTAAQLNQCYAS